MAHVMPGNAQALSVEATASRTSPAVMQKHTLCTLIIQESVSMKGIQVSLIIPAINPVYDNRLSSERTCENVRSSKRCKKIDSKCKNQVIPEGSCCPVCGK